MKSTWILVADNVHARIFTAATPSSELTEIEGLVHPAGRFHDREMTTDLPGKIKSADGGGHAFEQPTDPKKHEAYTFSQQVAQHLEAAHNAHEFTQLLIVAEPSFLGLLRNQLPDQVKKAVCFELDKNLSKQSAKLIRTHLPDYLPNF